MKKHSQKNNKKWHLSKKKQIILLFSFFGIGALTITTVTSCSSVSNSNSSSSTWYQLVDPKSSNGNLATNLSLKDAANDALQSTDGSTAWLKDKSYQLLYNWFSTSSNSTVKSQFNVEKSSVVSAYNSDVSSYKSQYGSSWNKYIQNQLFDPAGGTYQDYIETQMYSGLLTDFETDIFNTSGAGFDAFLSFFNTHTKSASTLTPMSSWNLYSGEGNSSSEYFTGSQSFINTTSNWAQNGSSSWNLGFYPSTIVYRQTNNSPYTSNPNLSAYEEYCNFDQYLFDQWVINENPFIASSILYMYPSSNATLSDMYNTKFFTNLPSSANLAFPYISAAANNQFDSILYTYLNSGYTSGLTSNNSEFYYNNKLNNWSPTATVYNSTVSLTGGFNFGSTGNVISWFNSSSDSTKDEQQSGYLMTNGANLTSSSSSYNSFSGYVPSYSSAIINRYDALVYNNNNTLTESATTAASDQWPLYNLISNKDLNSNLLANFLYSDINTSNGITNFTPSYDHLSATSIPTSFSVINPEYTTLYYSNGTPIYNSPYLSDYWSINSDSNPWSGSTISNNWYDTGAYTILSFNPYYSGSNGIKQLSPYVFTRDADGIHVVTIDGYDRIIAAEENPSSIASPFDVYPNPKNSYEAAVDAIAQDILWRAAQNVFLTQKNWYTVNLFSSLETYFKNNFATLLLGYAEQLLLTSSSSNYNQLFSKGYNLFSNTNLSNIFNTGNSTEEVATINLIYWISDLQNYLIEQSNENALKKLVLVSYTDNTGSSSSSSSSSSSYVTYGIGSATSSNNSYYKNGIKPAFMYAISLTSSLLYPYLSTYVYGIVSNSTLGLSVATTTKNNISFSNQNNVSYNIYSAQNNTANLDQTNINFSVFNELDKQLSTIKNSLDSTIINYLNDINFEFDSSIYNSQNSSNSTMQYSQYVLGNNFFVNAAIEAISSISSSSSELGNIVENTQMSNYLGVTNNSSTSNSNLPVSFDTNSILNNIFPLSSIDSNYSSSLNYLETALIYEYFLSDFTSTPSLTVNYGDNDFVNLADTNNNPYVPTATNSFDNAGSISSLTQWISEYYNYENNLYENNYSFTGSSSWNKLLTLLLTIEYLYNSSFSNNSSITQPWYNLWYQLNQDVQSGDTYVVWVGGDNTNNLNNTNINSSSKIKNTGSSSQYANGLNNILNNTYNQGVQFSSSSSDSSSSSSNSTSTNQVINYGAAGYTFNNINYQESGETLGSIGYSPFNYIPNPNLDGEMLSQYMDQQLANNVSSTISGSQGTSNYAYNNISTFFNQYSDYFNLANVNVTGMSGSGKKWIPTVASVPFTGFLGLQTSSSDSELSTLGLTDDLFDNQETGMNDIGVLSNYNGLGSEPQQPTSQNEPNLSNQPIDSLMYTILSATNSSELSSIGDTLNSINSNFPKFSSASYSNIPDNSNFSWVAYNYATQVYDDFTSSSSSGDYSWYFNNFSGYVLGSNSYDTDFDTTQDFYNVASGNILSGSSTNYDLPYNNLYTSYSYQNDSKTDGWVNYINSSDNPGESSLINDIAQDRLLSTNMTDINGNSPSYSLMMYVDQITPSTLGEFMNETTRNANGKTTTQFIGSDDYNYSWWSSSTPWVNLHLTEDAFAKLVVQIAENSNIQQQAINYFAKQHQVTIYDLRLRDALGSLWVLNWIIK